MYGKALAGVIFTAVYLFAVGAAACSFPPDHPTISLNSLPIEIEPDYNDAHIYTDTFNNCSGCVTELSVCYTVVLSQPTQLSVLIINQESVITHVHNITVFLSSFENHDINCTAYDEFSNLCCLRQTLTPSEQFTVQSNHHFGLWSSEIGLARHTMAPGYFTRLTIEVGRRTWDYDYNANDYGSTDIINDTIGMSYIYLNISQGDCATVSPSQVDQPQTTIGNSGTTEPSSSHLPAITATSASDITPSSSHSTDTTSSNVITPSSGYSTNSTIIAGDSTTATCTTSEHLCPRSTVIPSSSHRSTAHDVRPKTSVGESSTTSAMGAVHSSVPELRETDTHTATALLAGASGGGVVVILLVTAVVILGITCLVKKRVNIKRKGNGLKENENNIKLLSNTAYACTNTVATQEVPVPITTTSNSAYARSGHVTTSDEIYSYIPDESDLASSWKNATCIPMSHNESYAVTTQVKKVPENGLLDDDYVVSQLVYATADGDTELVKSNATPIKDDYVVNQLVYATASSDTSPDKPSMETATNEAYVCSNPATGSPIPVTSNEAYALSTLPANRSEVYELYESVLGNIDV